MHRLDPIRHRSATPAASRVLAGTDDQVPRAHVAVWLAAGTGSWLVGSLLLRALLGALS